MIDQDKMRALANQLRKGSSGRYKWYAMGRDEKSYFIDFNWEHDAERWLFDQKKSYSEWLEREGIHIVKKLFQTELETNAAAAADAIDLLLAEVEGLRAARIAYASEFPLDAEGEPDVGNIHANIRKLKQRVMDAEDDATRLHAEKMEQFSQVIELRAELEAAATDKRDAATLREILELRVSMKQRGDEVNASDKETKSHTFFDAEFNRRKWLLIDTIDAALAQRQGEGS